MYFFLKKKDMTFKYFQSILRRGIDIISSAKMIEELCAMAPPKIKLFRCVNYTNGH